MSNVEYTILSAYKHNNLYASVWAKVSCLKFEFFSVSRRWRIYWMDHTISQRHFNLTTHFAVAQTEKRQDFASVSGSIIYRTEKETYLADYPHPGPRLTYCNRFHVVVLRAQFELPGSPIISRRHQGGCLTVVDPTRLLHFGLDPHSSTAAAAAALRVCCPTSDFKMTQQIQERLAAGR